MNISQKARQILEERKAQSFPPMLALGEVDPKPTRNGLLKWIYAQGLVEASEFSAHGADKLLFARLVEILLPHDRFHPKTRSIAELQPNLEESLKREFPHGYVVKPAGTMNSDGHGVYLSGFLEEFSLHPDKFVGRSDFACELTGLVSSGEKYLVQELIGNREAEYRLHTLEGRVVKGATYTRWDQGWVEADFLRAEVALQRFLDQLPPWFVARQAWSVDMIDSEGFRLVEINSNRGRQGHWSGDLAIPDTLQAYALHLEKYHGAKFVGEGGKLFLSGQANLEGFLEKFGAESVARHAELRKALKK